MRSADRTPDATMPPTLPPRSRPGSAATTPCRRPTLMSAPTLHVSQHPAILHKLGILRDEATEPKKFREIVRELSWLLGYEALGDARVRPLEVKTPMETMQGAELADRIRPSPRLPP